MPQMSRRYMTKEKQQEPGISNTLLPLFCSKKLQCSFSSLEAVLCPPLDSGKGFLAALCIWFTGPYTCPCSVDKLPQPCLPSRPSSSAPLALQGGASFMRLLGTLPKTQTHTKKRKDSWPKQEGQAFLLTQNTVMGISSLCGWWAHTHSLNGISTAGWGRDWEQTEHLLCILCWLLRVHRGLG